MANRFADQLARHGVQLRRTKPRVLQVNVGKLCNLTCMHCHVNAGPGRKEIMRRDTADRILAWQERARLPIVDITGGAPEMIPHFRYFVQRLREIDPAATIIDRCNLTILLEPGYEDLPEFLAAQRVEIVASMPCYAAENVNAQRGEGVFDASIAALRAMDPRESYERVQRSSHSSIGPLSQRILYACPGNPSDGKPERLPASVE